jgi:DNA-binding transcriptional regulator YdaS (Cro superfamily)
MIIHTSPSLRKTWAASCGIAEAYLYQILTGRREASPALCVQIENASGKQVTRQMLRPKDWAQIWPELVEAARP